MFEPPIFYLRRQDFNDDGSINNVFFKNKLLIIFIHADYCGYCHMAKKDYQEAAEENKNKNIFFGAIQADGNNRGEKECSEIFSKICSNFQGYPDYAIFYNGIPVFLEIQSRDKKTILDTLNEYSSKKILKNIIK